MKNEGLVVVLNKGARLRLKLVQVSVEGAMPSFANQLACSWTLGASIAQHLLAWLKPCSTHKSEAMLHPQVSPAAILCAAINSQHLHHVGYGSELEQRPAGEFVVAAQEIGVKDVLPWAAANGAGFDLTQTDIAVGKDT